MREKKLLSSHFTQIEIQPNIVFSEQFPVSHTDIIDCLFNEYLHHIRVKWTDR